MDLERMSVILDETAEGAVEEYKQAKKVDNLRERLQEEESRLLVLSCNMERLEKEWTEIVARNL